MSAGAARFGARSTALAFVLRLVLAWATFDFGNSLTHVGAQKHIIETGSSPRLSCVDHMLGCDRGLPISPTPPTPFLRPAGYSRRRDHADTRRFRGIRRGRARPARRRW